MKTNDSRKVKKYMKEVVCSCCNGLGEIDHGDEWTGPGVYENCVICNASGMVKSYKGMRVIDTMTEAVA